jgi:hypothetical protein
VPDVACDSASNIENVRYDCKKSELGNVEASSKTAGFRKGIDFK